MSCVMFERTHLLCVASSLSATGSGAAANKRRSPAFAIESPAAPNAVSIRNSSSCATCITRRKDEGSAGDAALMFMCELYMALAMLSRDNHLVGV